MKISALQDPVSDTCIWMAIYWSYMFLPAAFCDWEQEASFARDKETLISPQMSLLWSSKNFGARSDVVLTDLQTLEERKPGGKAGEFLFSPWALTERQINFSFTNALFSSEETEPKGHPDDLNFILLPQKTWRMCLSTSGNLLVRNWMRMR